MWESTTRCSTLRASSCRRKSCGVRHVSSLLRIATLPKHLVVVTTSGGRRDRMLMPGPRRGALILEPMYCRACAVVNTCSNHGDSGQHVIVGVVACSWWCCYLQGRSLLQAGSDSVLNEWLCPHLFRTATKTNKGRLDVTPWQHTRKNAAARLPYQRDNLKVTGDTHGFEDDGDRHCLCQ